MTALTGLTALGVLAVARHADGAQALAGAAAVVAVAWLTGRRLDSPKASPAQPAFAGDAAPAGPSAEPPFPDAMEILPDPFMLVQGGDPDDLAGRRITYANAAARTLLRIPRDGALLVGVMRNPEVLEAVDASLFGGLVQTARYEAGGAQDRVWRAWTAPLATPIAALGEADRRYALLTLRDETETRRLERMRVDFLANASHELRTPLASLTGFIETLRGHAREDEGARDRFLEIMAAQADRMARLIDDLMSLSRIELNEHVPPVGDCDLAASVGDTLDALAPVVEGRPVSLRLSLPPPGAASVRGERDQILQVVQNLIDNAIKYSAPGGAVRVEVEVGLTLETVAAASTTVSRDGGGRLPLLTPGRRHDERYAVLRVVDEGRGLAREHLPRLAERFYRVAGQKSGERPGTGLGLAIVKHIVNRHRGGLVVESAPGRGATFSVYLPMTAPRSEAERAPVAVPRLTPTRVRDPSPEMS